MNPMAEDRSPVKNQTIVLNNNSKDNDNNKNLIDETIYSGCRSFDAEFDQRFSKNFYSKSKKTLIEKIFPESFHEIPRGVK